MGGAVRRACGITLGSDGKPTRPILHAVTLLPGSALSVRIARPFWSRSGLARTVLFFRSALVALEMPIYAIPLATESTIGIPTGGRTPSYYKSVLKARPIARYKETPVSIGRLRRAGSMYVSELPRSENADSISPDPILGSGQRHRWIRAQKNRYAAYCADRPTLRLVSINSMCSLTPPPNPPYPPYSA